MILPASYFRLFIKVLLSQKLKNETWFYQKWALKDFKISYRSMFDFVNQVCMTALQNFVKKNIYFIRFNSAKKHEKLPENFIYFIIYYGLIWKTMWKILIPHFWKIQRIFLRFSFLKRKRNILLSIYFFSLLKFLYNTHFF